MQPNKETVIKTMRSILNTSKNGLLEKHLRRDFRDMEGYEIPYKTFGCNTLLDFIRESGEFDCCSTNDGMQIYARVSQNSQHIVDLVNSQNRDRRKKSTKAMPFVPRFNSTANRKPTTVNNGRYYSQQPQRRQQNSQYFANTTNRNSNNNTYSRYASQTASTAPNLKQNHNENWNTNFNNIQQFNPVDYQLLLNRITEEKLRKIIAANITITQAQAQKRAFELAQAEAQIRMQLNRSNANASVAASAVSSMPKPNLTVNERLNPNYQSNQNGSSRYVETKSNLPAITSAAVPRKECHDKHVQEESDWDDEPSNVINLTKSSSEKLCTPSNGRFAGGIADKSTSNVDKWKHDLYDPNQKPAKMIATGATHTNTQKSFATNQTTNQRDVQNATLDQEKKISSSWLTYGNSTNEPVKKQSVFDRLGPKTTNDRQPSNDIQSRLLVQPPAVEKQTDTVDFVSQKQPQQSKQNLIHDNVTAAIEQKIPAKAVTHDKSETKSEKGSSKQMLEMYCHEKNFDAPIFECCRSRFKKFIGTVCVEGVKYSTEPIEYENESRAENAVAAKALENFKEFPIARDSSDDIARKIYDCIGDNGVFLKYLSNIFEQKYEESLPDGWPNIIENRPDMFSIHEQKTNLSIVFKKTLKSPEMPPLVMNSMNSQSTNSLPSSTTVNQNDAQVNRMVPKNNVNELPPMKLPWNQPYWKILITSATSSVDIWGRNLESEDWDDLDESLGCIEDGFLSDFTRPQPCHDREIIVGNLYLAVHETPSVEINARFDYNAYRVRVEEINRVKKQALCFYIDDGYTEWLNYESNLFHLHPNLLKYSAQAIHFSLCNVQDFEENSFACDEIRRQLLTNKPFVATIKTTQEQFEEQLEKIDAAAQISVILYDTTTEVDRNVNKEILQKICAQLQPPQLNPRHTNIVSVTHVCESADMFCRLYGSKEMQLVQRILDRIVKTVDIENYHVDPEQLMNPKGKMKLYLVYDKVSQRYYRAIVLPDQSKQSTVMCRCVDFGFTKSIPDNRIYDLARLSYALSNYPHQTILCQLNGIEPGEYPAEGIQRMRDLLVSQKPVYLDIVVRSEWPIVEVRTADDGKEYPLNGAIQRALEIIPDTESLRVPDDTFSSVEIEDDQNEHLVLHPKPKIGQSHIATVTTALNPSMFYVRLNANDSTYNKMINGLRKDCESSEKILSKNEIKVNHLYAARLQDGSWHRVKIQAIRTNQSVVVQKWDNGDIADLSIDALRPLNETFLKHHQMVFCASLHDLQPCQNCWKKDDCERFVELTVGKTFKIEVKDIRRVAENSYATELTLIRPDNSNVSEILVRENRAI